MGKQEIGKERPLNLPRPPTLIEKLRMPRAQLVPVSVAKGKEITFAGMNIPTAEGAARRLREVAVRVEEFPWGRVWLAYSGSETHLKQDAAKVASIDSGGATVVVADGVTGGDNPLRLSGVLSLAAVQYFAARAATINQELDGLFRQDLDNWEGRNLRALSNSFVDLAYQTGINPLDAVPEGESTLAWARILPAESDIGMLSVELFQVGGLNLGQSAVISGREIYPFAISQLPREIMPFLLQNYIVFPAFTYEAIEVPTGVKLVLTSDGVVKDKGNSSYFAQALLDDFPNGAPIDSEKLKRVVKILTADDDDVTVVIVETSG
jgi:hypothetical protein